MSENTISKKELLELTGITYGQLYRWKRKKLIPEEWFIKKSSFTGQETYFPKEKIIDRIDKILNLKEDLSLDQLAETFSPVAGNLNLSYEDASTHPLFRGEILSLYEGQLPKVLNFGDLLGLLICQDYLLKGTISREEGGKLIEFLQVKLNQLPEKQINLLYLRKFGIGLWLLSEANQLLFFEEDTKKILNVALQPYVEKLKSSAL